MNQRIRTEHMTHLGSIVNAVKMLITQGMAFRGHRENMESKNRGNFRAVMDLIGSHSNLVQHKICHGPKIQVAYLQSPKTR